MLTGDTREVYNRVLVQSLRRKAAARGRRAAATEIEEVTFLEQKVISTGTRYLYTSAVLGFEAWAKHNNRQLDKSRKVAKHMRQYFYSKYKAGHGPAIGRNTLYGWVHLRCDNQQKGLRQLSQCARSIKGWAKHVQETSKDPCPQNTAWTISEWMLENGFVDAGKCIPIQLDGYMRPSDALMLTRQHILKPSLLAGPPFDTCWGAVLAPQHERQRMKNGEFDCGVVFGINDRAWVAQYVSYLYTSSHGSDRLFPSLTLESYEYAFRKATQALDLQDLHVTPHTMRHTGPSHDRFCKAISLEEIGKRGHWKSLSSVRRYEKHACLLRQLNRLTEKQVLAGRAAARKLQHKLRHACGVYDSD